MAFPEVSVDSIVTYVGVGIGTAIGATIMYLRGKKEADAPVKDVVLREATIADMNPVREAAEHLKSIAENFALMAALLAAQDKRAVEREEEARDAELTRLRQLEADLKAKQGRQGFRAPRRHK
jgi:hypothetical protein